MDNKKGSIAPILFAVFLIAICGIIYELLIGAISSYLMGDSVKQYSITIGLFMSAMGVGSALSKRIDKNLFDKFVIVELLLGVVGGFSGFILFYTYAYTEIYFVFMYVCIITIGILVGLEIPILTRMLNEEAEELRETIANILSFDYIGALIGSLAFPLVLLPNLGQLKTSFLVGIINITVGIVLIFIYKEKLENYNFLKCVGIGLFFIMGTFFINGDKLSKSVEDSLYRDRIVYSTQTKYQKIVATKHKDDFRLFLNGNIQFSSKDEYRYHEVLVHPAMNLAKEKKRILILGGGDGLAIREVLKYEEVEEITLVDIDEEMVKYCRTNREIKELNKGALESEKLELIVGDAYVFLEENRELYDVIIVDLPDPNNEGLNKLYTNVFYRLTYNSLSEEGVLVAQSTSPLNSNSAFWCINETIKSEGFKVKPMEVYVPSFGSWGFNICKKKEFDIDMLKIDKELKFLNNEMLKELFILGEDEKKREENIQINTLNKPKLIEYYNKAVDRM